MADYFDFIKKPVTNATVNPPTGNDKSPAFAQATAGKQITNDKTAGQTVSSVIPSKAGIQKTGSPIGVGDDKKTANQTTNNLDLMTHLTQRSNRVMMAAQAKAKELKLLPGRPL